LINLQNNKLSLAPAGFPYFELMINPKIGISAAIFDTKSIDFGGGGG
jgi:hypothetical protein